VYPYLIKWGGFFIPAYPIIYGLAITMGGVVLLWLGRKEGLPPQKLVHTIPIVAVSCVLGGRLFYVLHFPGDFQGIWGAFDLSHGGQVFYGGLLLGIPAVILLCKLSKLPWVIMLDLTAVSAPAGLALGRWACFCRGCCYGRITDLPWAVKFPKHVDIYGDIVGSPAFISHLHQELITKTDMYSLPIHPAQIYSSLFSIGVFLVMIWLWKTKRARGKLWLAYLVFYSGTRFTVEFFRENQMAFANLTVAQVFSIVIGISAGSILLITHNKIRKKIMPCTIR